MKSLLKLLYQISDHGLCWSLTEVMENGKRKNVLIICRGDLCVDGSNSIKEYINRSVSLDFENVVCSILFDRQDLIALEQVKQVVLGFLNGGDKHDL